MKRILFISFAALALLWSGAAASAQDAPTPYVTGKTVYIYKKVPFSALQPVSDGKFLLNEYNKDFGYGSYWSSWTIGGKKLYAPEWEQFGRSKPMWDSGVCVLKDPKVGLPVILYAEGKIREFRKNCGQVSQFVDGISMVVETLEEGVVSYYINPEGEKIYAHLEENELGYRATAVVRPVKDGLRAFYSNKSGAWGYLDATGNVVIEARYHDVRDFANGYALIITKNGNSAGYLAFIDKSGNEVCKPCDTSVYSVDSAHFISDTDANGVYCVSDNYGQNTKYYNVRSQAELYKSYSGMGFQDGYAFLIPEGGEENRPDVVDKGFKKVGSWDFTHGDFAYRKPVFSPYGLVTIGQRRVLDNKGKVVLMAPEDGYIGDFCDEGYAPFAGEVSRSGKEDEKVSMSGYCLPSGEIVLAFLDVDPVVVVDENPPREPTPIPRIPAKYKVKVVAHPENGGTVYGSGEYKLGDTVRVTGTPAEKFEFAGLKQTKLLKKTKQYNKFVVQGDGTVDCYFVEDIKPQDPDTTAGYLGSMPLPQYDGSVVNVPIWLQISKDKDVKSPYGDNTYGYLAVAYDPSKMLHMRNNGTSEDELFFNMFMVPMLVRGIYKDVFNRKTYLMLDGGEVAVGNMMIKEKSEKTGKTNSFNTAMANLMLLFDGFNEVKITPARYRVEILGGDIGDDSFTFGQLERLSVEHGWLPGAHKAFTERKKGLFVRSQSAGLDAAFLADRFMVMSNKKPQIWWEPTLEFYGGKVDKETLGKYIEKLGKQYREYVSDIDMIRDFNFGDFILDLENNVLKSNKQTK